MQQVKVNKSELLEKVKANREKHITDHAQAVENYWITVKGKLEDALATVEKKSTNKVFVLENKPESHVDDYDQVLSMLEMSVEDTITLENHEYSQYVMDKWNWKAGFATTNAVYAASAGAYNNR